MLRRAAGSGDGGEPEGSSLEGAVRERGGVEHPRCRAPRRRPRRPGCRQQRRARARPPSGSRSTASCALPVAGGGAAERRRTLQSSAARPSSRERAARELRAGLVRPPTACPRERSSGDDAGIERRRVSSRTPRGFSATAPFARIEEVRRVGCREGGGARRVRARRAERQRCRAGASGGAVDTGSPGAPRRTSSTSPVELRAARGPTRGRARSASVARSASPTEPIVGMTGCTRRSSIATRAVDDLRRHAGAPDPRGPRRARRAPREPCSVEAAGPSAAARPTRMRRARSGSSGRPGQADVGAEARGRPVDALAVRGRPGRARRRSPATRARAAPASETPAPPRATATTSSIEDGCATRRRSPGRASSSTAPVGRRRIGAVRDRDDPRRVELDGCVR